MENKREVSILIPYKLKNSEVLVYLQKRDKNASRLPDFFGIFGGGIEGGESVEEALKREIKEELDLNIEGYDYLGRYEFDGNIKNVFKIKVDENFESTITILEGEYGKWFSKNEVANEPKFIEEDKKVLLDFFSTL